ncbi:MAG: Gfo/Idh/MocA family oxidoreductase [Pseudomonadota bacterium]
MNAPVPPIRLGMVGGGQGAFIGAIHRIASRIDGEFELVAGALSSTAERSLASGEALGLRRVYGTFAEMAQREARRKDGIEAVAIVTPNHLHFPVAREFLRRGVHVICEKPLTATTAQAKKLAGLCQKSAALFVLTHSYTGYPMVRQARAMVAAGDLGQVRLVQVEYPQGWLATKLEDRGVKQAQWRTDPAQSGPGGCIADLGTHAMHLATYVSGLRLEAVCADLDQVVDGRSLDDNAHVLMRYQGGAKGLLWASQVAPGHENGLRLRLYGTKGGLDWAQEAPDSLWHAPLGRPKRLLTRGGAGTGAAANRVTRTPFGHPEGYLEAFANIYSEAARAIHARHTGEPLDPAVSFPGIVDGLAGMAFIDACLRSNARGGRWVRF